MFEYQQNTLCVATSWLLATGIITESNLKNLISRGKLKKLTVGGNGRKALVAYESIPEKFKNAIREKVGDPYATSKKIIFADYMVWDYDAEAFFKAYILENGTNLPDEKQQEYTHQAIMFNAVKHIAQNVVSQRKFGGKQQMWERMLNAIQNLPATWLHTRYKNVVSFKRAYKKYDDEGFASIVSGKWLNANSTKIEGEVADWILAQYALPVKHKVSDVFELYESVREIKGWKPISERTIGLWLEKTEQKRVWMAGRDGKETYMKYFGHTVTRARSDWFPNAWWAIDGTKLDLVHFKNNKQKMAAELKVNVVFDIYSEKIIGWDLAYTENHASHFRALKKAVSTAGCRPYLFTYDKQSGHTASRMQDLYNKLPAKGGTHYSHKVGRKSSPAEQIFNRLQQQVISKMWFSDKQGVKVRKATNRPNVDFIVEYKNALPVVEDFYKIFAALVNVWNQGKQKDWEMSRNERYAQPTEHREAIDMMTQLALFWIDETKPKKYYAHGLPLTVEGKDYLYEVYDADNNIDLEFRRKWVNEKVIVRYDPEYLEDYVALYELTASGEKRFIAYAQKKRTHESIPVLFKEDAKVLLNLDKNAREQEWDRDYLAYLELEQKTGISREQTIEDQELLVKMQGVLPKETQMEVDSNAHFHKY